MSQSLTLHLLQWRIIPGDVNRNCQKAEELLASVSPEPGDMVLLPELFTSGFSYPHLGGIAGEHNKTIKWMGNVSSHYGIGLAGSIPVLCAEGITNSMKLVGRTGEALASYDKIHLFSVADEDSHFIPGSDTTVVRWEGVDVGMAICFDLRFPEMARKLCDNGAEIALVPAQWPRARADHFRDFVRVRAMENQMYVAACNSCGDDGKGLVLGGQSVVMGPSGDVKGVLGEEEGVLTVNVDLNEVEHVRGNFPVLKVRRRDLFD